MAKSVLISIRPQWVEKIFNGSKTIEVRRTFPKQLETPFKALVYCTKAKHIPEDGLYFLPNDKQLYLGCKKKDLGFVCWEGDFRNGKVIGSFVCDRVRLCIPFGLKGHLLSQEVYREMCLTKEQLDKYGGLKTLYGWHITAPKLFDKPRELCEFCVPCKEYDSDKPHCGGCDYYKYSPNDSGDAQEECLCNGSKPLRRPPQSWCYVEELQ